MPPVRRSFHVNVVCGFQVAALVLFFSAGHLTHFHQNRVTPTDRHEHREQRAPVLHAHLEGHPHDHPVTDNDGSGEDTATSIAYGKPDSPRQALFPEPPAAILTGDETLHAGHEAWSVFPDPGQDAHGPPGPSTKSVRAPPSFS